MSTERRQMDDEATSNEEIQPLDEGTTPHRRRPNR
jgi:hypothetical protein